MKLTDEDLSELQIKFPTKDVKYEYEFALDWLEATGKRYKDYKAFMRNWLRRAKDKQPPRADSTIEKLRSMEISEEQRQKNLAHLESMRKLYFGGRDEDRD